MTIQVRVSHNTPGYVTPIQVQRVDENGKPWENEPPRVLNHGESDLFWVWKGASIMVSEVQQ